MDMATKLNAAAKMAAICWIAMLVLSVLNFGFYNGEFRFYGTVFSILSSGTAELLTILWVIAPIILIVGAFVSTHNNGRSILMVYSMGLFIVVSIVRQSLLIQRMISYGYFNVSFLIPLIHFAMMAGVTFVFFMSIKKHTNTRLVTNASLISAVVCCLVSGGYFVVQGKIGRAHV